MAGMPVMDVPKNPSKLKRPTDVGSTSVRKAPSLMRRVMALLVQYPELEQIVAKQNLNLDEFGLAGQELLGDVLQKIALEKPENSAILLEAYRGSVYEKTINALAGLELDVPEEGVEAEFSGALSQLLRQVKQGKLSELLAKEEREGLSAEEKQVLRALFEQHV